VEITFQPTGLSQEKTLNVFTASSGLLARPLEPIKGFVFFDVLGTRLDGSVNLQGVETFGGDGAGSLTVSFEAQLSSTDPECVVDAPLEQPVGADPKALAAASRQVRGTRFVVERIEDLTQIDGSPAFLPNARRRIGSAVLVVQERAGGAFAFVPPDARNDLYPLLGSVTGTPPLFTLAAQTSVGDAATPAESIPRPVQFETHRSPHLAVQIRNQP
jgi:hypothetical protein